MLPFNLLPSGALTAMRSTANQFMTEPITLYTQTLTYNEYGEQTTTLSGYFTGVGYLGKLSGSDREIYKTTMQYRTGRDGIENTFPALLLLPFETSITEQTVVSGAGYLWSVIWQNNDTQDSVQVYTKAIIERTVERDGSTDV